MSIVEKFRYDERSTTFLMCSTSVSHKEIWSWTFELLKIFLSVWLLNSLSDFASNLVTEIRFLIEIKIHLCPLWTTLTKMLSRFLCS